MFAKMDWTQLVRRKPMDVILREESSEELVRQLGLFDLLCIGIGGTVGSGIFAIAGQIIAETAGPSALISWTIAGIACCLSGFSYMELSSRIPSSGSCYAYTYHVLGELPAVIAAWLLTLEYGVSGAGVARSWASKVMEYVHEHDPNGNFLWLNKEYYSLLSFAIQAVSVIIILVGLRLGKLFINTITVIKVSLVLFMIIAGLSAFDSGNMDPFVPARIESNSSYGASGIILGASQAFFGFIGFDEVCCLAAEAKNPRKVMPLAVIGVILGTMFLSALASLSLAGMQPYQKIVGFAGAFQYVDYSWGKTIVQIGEIATMPVVVLVAFLAQPRLLYAMSIDGLLPPIFSKVDQKGNIFWNTVICGIVCCIIALTIPFNILWDVISFGILFSFNLTNCCLILMRAEEQSLSKSYKILGGFFGASIVFCFLLQNCVIDSYSLVGTIFCIAFGILSLIAAFQMWMVPKILGEDKGIFYAPCVPLIPLLAIVVNWYLMAQLGAYELLYGILWIALGIISYFSYGFFNSESINMWRTQKFDLAVRPSLNEVRPSINQMVASHERSLDRADQEFFSVETPNTKKVCK